MSHFTRVTVQVKEEKHLLEALKEMKLTPIQGGVVRGYMGDKMKADYVVRGSGSYDIGFLKRGDGFELVADWWGIGRDKTLGSQQEFTRKLEDEYAAAVTVAEVKKQGFMVSSRKVDAQGRIQIVARKY